MNTTNQHQHYLSADQIAGLAERRHVHQFNDNAIRLTRTLSELTGMERIGVHLIRLEQHRDSTTFHYHDAQEEFIYVVQGRGIAEVGNEVFTVGAGDFFGFPAPSAPHLLRNPHAEPLVYLVGGERGALDVVHYPRLQRSMLKYPNQKRWMRWSDIHEVESGA